MFYITQETFDDAVNENIREFEMTPELAIQGAVEQFTAQGANLENIIKDNVLLDSLQKQNLIELFDNLKRLLKSEQNNEKVLDELKLLETECDKGMPYKILAANLGAYEILIDLLLTENLKKEILLQCLKTLAALMDGQPDLLCSRGIEFMLRCFAKQEETIVLHHILVWIKHCCLKHETNRQNIFNANLVDYLKPLLLDADAELLKSICAVLRSLVLDDDIRVEFGNAHIHARHIADKTLGVFTNLLSKYKSDESIIVDLMATLSSLIVRNEFCVQVEEAGGLQFVLDVLTDLIDNKKIIRQALKLLKVLAGNDSCKVHIVQKGGAQIIYEALNVHKDSRTVCIMGLNCIATLSLRSPENSRMIFEAGLPDLIVACMKIHPDDGNVQKSASWAIRNMVSRSRYQNEKFLSLDVEDILQSNLVKFGDKYGYDFKAALRDLDCAVDFKEEWTGEGGYLTTQSQNE